MCRSGTSVNENQKRATRADQCLSGRSVRIVSRGNALYVSNIDAFTNNAFNVSRPINFGTVHADGVGQQFGQPVGALHRSRKNGSNSTSFGCSNVSGFAIHVPQSAGLIRRAGAGSLDMTTGNQIVNSIRNGIGVWVTQEAMWGNVPWWSRHWRPGNVQHEWGNGTQVVTSSFSGAPTVQFATSGNHTGRNFGLDHLRRHALCHRSFQCVRHGRHSILVELLRPDRIRRPAVFVVNNSGRLGGRSRLSPPALPRVR